MRQIIAVSWESKKERKILRIVAVTHLVSHAKFLAKAKRA
jgi:hypothetical protein